MYVRGDSIYRIVLLILVAHWHHMGDSSRGLGLAKFLKNDRQTVIFVANDTEKYYDMCMCSGSVPGRVPRQIGGVQQSIGGHIFAGGTGSVLSILIRPNDAT